MNKYAREIAWLLQEKYHGRQTAAFKKDVLRFKRGEPLDYLIGFVEFLDCHIDLSKRPLIPRQETEFWVQEAIEQMSSNDRRSSIIGRHTALDMFAGSGAIGIAIMRNVIISQRNYTFQERKISKKFVRSDNLKDVHVTFADSEKNCIEQIKINCRKNKLPAGRYTIIQSDIFESVKGTFDYIFANPPYIPTKNKHKIQPSVLKHEPEPALFGGGDGLDIIRRFLAGAKNRLNSGGKIYMEFDPPQKKAIAALAKQNGYRAIFHRDQYKKWRYVVLNVI